VPNDKVAFKDSTNATVLAVSFDPVLGLGGGGILVAAMAREGGLGLFIGLHRNALSNLRAQMACSR